MKAFFMFGKYASGAVENHTENWTRQIVESVQAQGGELQEMYALLGAYDLLLIAQFPTIEQALKTSISISKSLKISFSTMPAIPVEEFDRLVESP